MCRSIAALGYGLFVRTASLLAAADAHTKVEPTRRFVELVKLRRERGTLQAEGGGVERLPSEVWGMVLQEVIDVEVDEAMRCLMKKHLFPSCEGVIDGPTNFKAFELEYSDPTWVEAVENAAVRSCATCLTEGFDGWRMLLEEPGVQVRARRRRPF